MGGFTAVHSRRSNTPPYGSRSRASAFWLEDKILEYVAEVGKISTFLDFDCPTWSSDWPFSLGKQAVSAGGDGRLANIS